MGEKRRSVGSWYSSGESKRTKVRGGVESLLLVTLRRGNHSKLRIRKDAKIGEQRRNYTVNWLSILRDQNLIKGKLVKKPRPGAGEGSYSMTTTGFYIAAVCMEVGDSLAKFGTNCCLRFLTTHYPQMNKTEDMFMTGILSLSLAMGVRW